MSGYSLRCEKCDHVSWAANIVDLTKNHVGENHMFRCGQCGAVAYLYSVSTTLEGEEWERWVKGVIRIDYKRKDIRNYHPYVYLITHKGPKGKIDSVQMSYYKDLRKQGKSLKHGHGPGGTPVLGISDLKSILEKLQGIGVM
jgi:hypothetical protein